METKRCTKCGETLSLHLFRYKPKKARYESRCLECQKLERASYDIKNKLKISIRRKAYRELHKDHIDANTRKWVNENKERWLSYCREYSKMYHKAHKDRACARKKLYYYGISVGDVTEEYIQSEINMTILRRMLKEIKKGE
jgi:hypothetical protein